MCGIGLGGMPNEQVYTDYNLHKWEFLLGGPRLPFYIIRVVIKIVYENGLIVLRLFEKIFGFAREGQ